MTNTVFPVLDPAQLRRIESTHGGFLYQHIYGAGCLLLAPSGNVLSVLIERDEDVELRLADRHVYLQIKTRDRQLQLSDISETLERFQRLTGEHTTTRKGLDCEHWIISNVAPSPSLAKHMVSDKWPKAVALVWPSCLKKLPPYLPQPWLSIPEGVTWCAAVADQVPLAKLSAETLVWKLAATVQFAATGNAPYTDHTFETSMLPKLFEQIIIQVQRFPDAPTPYRELENEPQFVTTAHARIITGHSGSGKTAWASESCRHLETRVAYVDMGQLPSEAVTTTIVRELAAQVALDNSSLATIVAPGINAIDSLRLLDQALQHRHSVLVVIDNAHQVSIDVLQQIIISTTHIQWVFLAQPVPRIRELGTLDNCSSEEIRGWTVDSVVSEFAYHGMPLTVSLAHRLRKVTGGAPLFVRQAAHIAVSNYAKAPENLCAELETRTHTVETAQERLLQTVVAGIQASARTAGSVLSLSDVPLEAGEARALLAKVLDCTEQDAASHLRVLDKHNILIRSGLCMSVHDSFRLVMPKEPEVEQKTLPILKSLILSSLNKTWSFGRFSFLIQIMVRSGDIEAITELATTEEDRLMEFGLNSQIEPLLKATLTDKGLDAEKRFWALDTLIFWKIMHGDMGVLQQQIQELEELYNHAAPDKTRLGSLLIKKMLLAGRMRDPERARSVYRTATVQCADKTETLRILKYDLAATLLGCKEPEAAEAIASELIDEYFDVLHWKPQDVFCVNPPEIAKKLGDSAEAHAILKRLADTLELRACSRHAQKLPSGLDRIFALKFFIVVSAFTSAIRIGQNVADELLEIGDPTGALKIIEEQLLPIVNTIHLLDHLIPVRSQRAVIWAYLGKHQEARKEIDVLKSFAIGDTGRRAELENQTDLIDRIARGELTLKTVVPSNPLIPHIGRGVVRQILPGTVGVGSNQPCPCGSGKKYKKCCGRYA